jgi:ureidoacrylate peracid hydrolase
VSGPDGSAGRDYGAAFVSGGRAALEAGVELTSTALLVVDMQNDLCHPDGFYGGRGRPVERLYAVHGAIAVLLEEARRDGLPIVYTKEIFNERLPDLISRHALKPDVIGDVRGLRPGSWGAAIIDELAPRDEDFIIEKPDYSAFYETQLTTLLKRLQIRTLIITGILTHACLLHTVFDAFVRDFDVIVVSDTVASYEEELSAAALSIIDALLGPVISLDEAIGLLRAKTGEVVGSLSQ